MENQKTVEVIVGNGKYIIDTKLLPKYPDSVISTAYRFNHSKDTLDFGFHDNKYFEIVLGIYLHDRINIPDGLSTYKDLKDDMLFWGFEIVDPVVLSVNGFNSISPVTSLVWPWGVFASTKGNSRWIPIVCTFFELMLTCTPILRVVSLGYKNVHIYLKHNLENDSIGLSLVLTRSQFLQKLAELNACYVEFLDGVYGSNITREARIQDILCNGDFTVDNWVYVTHQALKAQCIRRGMDNLIIKASEPQQIQFVYRGFRLEISIQGSELTWDCKSINESEEPLLLEDTRGFLFRLQLIVNNASLGEFKIPACDWVCKTLKFQLSRSIMYETDDPTWFCLETQPTRSSSSFQLEATDENVSIHLVIYRASKIKLNAHNIQKHENMIDDTSYYERLLLTW